MTITSEQIAKTAAILKDDGLPDVCNRMIGMTPEAFAAGNARRAKIARTSHVRRTPKAERGKSTIALGHAANLDEAGKALLKQQHKDAEAKKRQRFQHLKELNMTKKIGAKEQALRNKRGGLIESTEKMLGELLMSPAKASAATTKVMVNAVDATKGEAPSTQETTVTTKKATKSKARTAVKGKTAKKAAPKAPKAAKATEGKNLRPDGLRVGSGMATLADTVCRPEGATHEELCKAVGWAQCLPMMKKAAERAGITLKTVKEDGKPTRYFGTPAKAKAAA